MSSGTGYDHSYVDREAERRRAVRAELASLAERVKGFNAQAKAVQRAYRTQRIRVAAVSVPTSADTDRAVVVVVGTGFRVVVLPGEAERGCPAMGRTVVRPRGPAVK